MKMIPKKASKKLLITGTTSGLGRYLHENLDSISWNKDTSDKEKALIKKEGVDIIIHCAFNSSQRVTSDSLYEYIKDNVFLTKELIDIPHKRFIFISSIDVYPNDNKKHREDEIIDTNSVQGIYALTKLISESLVKNRSSNYLILRCSSLLGKYSRKNSLIKIIKEESPILTLSPNSSLNYILHADVLKFIQSAIKNNLQGTYNVASSENITIFQAAALINKKIQFGSFTYNAGKVNTKKIIKISPVFKKTSKEVITEFLNVI